MIHATANYSSKKENSRWLSKPYRGQNDNLSYLQQ